MGPLTLTRLAAPRSHTIRRSYGLNRRALTARSFTTCPLTFYPRKDSQDRESINTEATEYSKSGTDDAAARNEEAAFDPKTTRPEEEEQVAGKGNKGNPLNASPANPEISKPKGAKEEKA